MAKADWNAIRAEYIGGASYGELAKKHHLSKSTIYEHSKLDDWQTMRTKAANAARTQTIQRTAAAAASNAVLLEEARTLAIKKIKKAIEQMPDNGGSHSRTFIQKDGKRLTVDYDLLDLVVALEKMMKNDSDQTGEAVTVIIDV